MFDALIKRLSPAFWGASVGVYTLGLLGRSGQIQPVLIVPALQLRAHPKTMICLELEYKYKP